MTTAEPQSYPQIYRRFNRIRPKTLTVVLFLLLGSCTSYQQQMLESDRHALYGFQLFFEQEAHWGDAIQQADKKAATQAVDSMLAIIDFFQPHDSSEMARTKDSIYFSKIQATIKLLHVLSDSVYPMIMEKAFLPDMAYTYREEKTVMKALQFADSTVADKMKAIKLQRNDFLQRMQAP